MSDYTDHIPTWEILANHNDFGNMTVLEYGCGAGTKTLCQLFEKCISVELFHESFLSDVWFDALVAEQSQNQIANWQGRTVRVSQNICKLEQQIRQHNQILLRQNDEFTDELKCIIEQDIERHKPDVVFIDPGIHLRGEMAKIIMDNCWANMVVVHDYNWPDPRYGYNLLENTPNFSRIIPVPGGLGTAVYEFCVPDAKVLVPKKFHDNRGFFTELFNENFFDFSVKQVNYSYSNKGTIRGIHQAPFEKLVTCLQGAILDVCVDLRKHSKTYLQHIAVELNPQNGRQLLIPKDCGHAFLALQDSVVVYGQSDTYCPKNEVSVRFDDPTIGIRWPSMDYIISSKDAASPFIQVDGHTTQPQSQRMSDYLEGWL